MEFGCENCGCSAVTLPEELVNSELVRCNRCRRVFCTWAEFKEQTRRVLWRADANGMTYRRCQRTAGTYPISRVFWHLILFSALGPGPKRQIAATTSRFGFTTGQSRGSGSPSWVAGSYPSGKVRGTARQFIANVRLSLTGNHEQLDELALLYGR